MFYDDSEYDYMQHLRGVEISSSAEASSTLVEAPRKNDLKGKGKAVVTLKDASQAEEETQTYKDYLESTFDEGGLRPDLDPALRETLEALEDEAYVEVESDHEGQEGRGDFFDDLIKGTVPLDHGDFPLHTRGDASSTFGDQVRTMRSTTYSSDDDDQDVEDDENDLVSEGGDTVAELQAASARRPPRRAGTDRKSVASGSAFSMSSASMSRNDGLRTLDDRFDQVGPSQGMALALPEPWFLGRSAV